MFDKNIPKRKSFKSFFSSFLFLLRPHLHIPAQIGPLLPSQWDTFPFCFLTLCCNLGRHPRQTDIPGVCFRLLVHLLSRYFKYSRYSTDLFQVHLCLKRIFQTGNVIWTMLKLTSSQASNEDALAPDYCWGDQPTYSLTVVDTRDARTSKISPNHF